MTHQWNQPPGPQPLVWTTNNTSHVQPSMVLDANGNLGIGAGGSSGQITLHDGVETAVLTVQLLKELKKFAGFVEYAKKCDKNIADLWTAYEVANKLDKSNEPHNN